ncbi:MAG: ADP-ribosylglycohydrolase family protein [Planctomycetes bacterium]|nr:ADP-ribosylglycohydrolase family protein [Planctomycetota bacterium]
MEGPENVTLQRFRGAVLGAAVADALALPYEHYSRAFLRSVALPLVHEIRPRAGGLHPRGQYSSETQEMLAVLDSILETGDVAGEAMASHLVPLWRDSTIVDGDPTSARAMERLARGLATWEDSGLEGHAEAAPLGRVLAIGLWHHDSAGELCEAAACAVRITHRDPRVAAAAAAAAQAIAFNVRTEELVLGEFLDRVAEAARRHDGLLGEAILDFPRTLSVSEARALRHFESIAPDDRYPAGDEGLSEHCIPAVLTALYYFLKHPYAYEQAVEGCLRCGGRLDTPAFLAGAFCGALVGESGVPARLAEEVLGAPDIAARADALHNAWAKRREERP